MFQTYTSYLAIILTGDEAANSNDTSWSMDCSTVVRVKTLHISSPILAAKSPFFYKVDASSSCVRFEFFCHRYIH